MVVLGLPVLADQVGNFAAAAESVVLAVALAGDADFPEFVVVVVAVDEAQVVDLAVVPRSLLSVVGA